MQTNEIKKAWRKMIKTGEADPHLRPEIRASWVRCYAAHVDPLHGFGKSEPPEVVERILRDNRELIQIAEPMMSSLYKPVKGYKTIMYLIDCTGHLLCLVGRQEGAEIIDLYNMCEGSRWLETDVGTTAFSLCLEHDRPMIISGAEHYCQNHQICFCSAAPIHAESGALLGAIIVTSLKFNEQSSVVTVAAAGAIERQIALLNAKNMLEHTQDSIDEGILIMDAQFRIARINAAAERIIDCSDAYVGHDAHEFISKSSIQRLIYGHDISFNIHIENRAVPCVGNFYPLLFDSVQTGSVVVFNPEKRINQLTNRVSGNRAAYSFADIMTVSPAMQRLLDQAKALAPSDCNVLIAGESGTGKEMLAQSIHNDSSRRDGPFITINCAALPKDSIGGVLFGYSGRGVPDDKQATQPGKLELADGGTLFLDEVSELPPDVQRKLLKVLDDGVLIRLGGAMQRHPNIRVIAATSHDLTQALHNSDFNIDLFYRINVITLRIPALSERPEDVVLLAEYFLDKLNEGGGEHAVSFSPGFLRKLKTYPLARNVRQLQSIVSRAYYARKRDILDSSLLPEPPGIALFAAAELADGNPLIYAEKQLLLSAIKDCDGNMTGAAAKVGMSRSTFYRRLKKLGLSQVRIAGNESM